MKKAKAIWLLILLVVPVLLLSGCESVTKRADTQDTWNRIERRKRVIVGLDDSFVPMGFRQKNGKLVGYDVDLARAVFKQYGICDLSFLSVYRNPFGNGNRQTEAS